MTKLCICQICNCGRHRCPHHPQPVINKAGQQCSLSEYANRYIPHPLDMRQSLKPAQKPSGGEGAMADETTNRMDYIKHPFEKPYMRQPAQYVRPDGEIDGTTNYANDYTKKPIAVTKPIRRDLARSTPGKFEGNPTYKSDYRKFSAPLTKPIIREQDFRPSSKAFEGLSSYTDDYIKHNAPVRQSMRPAENANPSDEPFAKQTGYRDDYTRKPMPPREFREKPKYEATKAPLEGLSNYMQDYIPKQFQVNQSCKPENTAFRSSAPLDDETTQRADYTVKPYEKPWVRQQDAYQTPAGCHDFNTTNQLEYTKKPINKTSSKKPEARKGDPGKFNDGTNYKEDYRKWPLGEKQQYKNKDVYVPSDAQFEGMPTYTADYTKYNEPPRQSLRPAERAKMSDEPFADKTGYRDDYTRKQMPERERREKAVYIPNKAPLQDASNYRDDYTQKQIQPQPSFKPDNTAFRSDAPLEDNTTFRNDYQKWPLSRPFIHEHDQYTKPAGSMEKDTTSGLAYTPKPMNKAMSTKPAARKGEPGKFDGYTNYKGDYRQWDMGDRAQPKPKDEYAAPTNPFEGTSNYTDAYIQHPNVGTRSLKPAEQGMQSNAPFEGGTEYKKEYTGKYLPPCPAGVIQSGGSTGFVFQEQDPSGHKWYQPGTSTSVIDLKPISGKQIPVC